MIPKASKGNIYSATDPRTISFSSDGFGEIKLFAIQPPCPNDGESEGGGGVGGEAVGKGIFIMLKTDSIDFALDRPKISR